MKCKQWAGAAALLTAASVMGAVQAQPLSIGTVHNQGYRYLDGAGCTYIQPGHRVDFDNEATWQYLLLSGLDSDAAGWVSIGGQVVELKRTQDSAYTPLTGEQRRTVFEGQGVKATLAVFITQVDSGNWDEEGTLTVERQGQQASVPVAGNCGS